MESLSRVCSQLDKFDPSYIPSLVSSSLLSLLLFSSLSRSLEIFFHSPYSAYKILNGAISCKIIQIIAPSGIVMANLCIFLDLALKNDSLFFIIKYFCNKFIRNFDACDN